MRAVNKRSPLSSNQKPAINCNQSTQRQSEIRSNVTIEFIDPKALNKNPLGQNTSIFQIPGASAKEQDIAQKLTHQKIESKQGDAILQTFSNLEFPPKVCLTTNLNQQNTKNKNEKSQSGIFAIQSSHKIKNESQSTSQKQQKPQVAHNFGLFGGLKSHMQSQGAISQGLVNVQSQCIQQKRSPSKNVSQSSLQTNLVQHQTSSNKNIMSQNQLYTHQSNKSTSSLHSLSHQASTSNIQSQKSIHGSYGAQGSTKHMGMFHQAALNKFNSSNGSNFQNFKQSRQQENSPRIMESNDLGQNSGQNYEQCDDVYFQFEGSKTYEVSQLDYIHDQNLHQTSNINNLILDTVIQKQQELADQVEILSHQKDIQDQSLNNKLATMEKSLNSCLEILFERISLVEQKVRIQDNNQDEKLNILSEKILMLQQKIHQIEKSVLKEEGGIKIINKSPEIIAKISEYQLPPAQEKFQEQRHIISSGDPYKTSQISTIQFNSQKSKASQKRKSGITNSKCKVAKAIKDQTQDLKSLIDNPSFQRNPSFTDKKKITIRSTTVNIPQSFRTDNISDENSEPFFTKKSERSVQNQSNSQSRVQKLQTLGENQNLINFNQTQNSYKIKEKEIANFTLKTQGQDNITKQTLKEQINGQDLQRQIELRIPLNTGEENILTTYSESFKTLENTIQENLQSKTGKKSQRLQQSKANSKLIENYQKNIPSKQFHQKGLSSHLIAKTFVDYQDEVPNSIKGEINHTFQHVQMPQNSLIAKTVNKQALGISNLAALNFSPSPSVGSHSNSSDERRPNSRNKCKSSILQQAADELSQSPKFINFINKSDVKTELKQRASKLDWENQQPTQAQFQLLEPHQLLVKNQFLIDNEQTIELEVFAYAQNATKIQMIDDKSRNQQIQLYDTILSKEDQNDFDERRVDTFQRLENVKNDTQALNGVSANSVYQSKNMNLSRFISSNKSQIDFKNNYNKVEFRNLTELLLQKGNRCQCTQSQFKSEDTSDICGEYCKRLSSFQERDIIQQILNQEQNTPITKEDLLKGRMSPQVIHHNRSTNINKKSFEPSSRSRSPVNQKTSTDLPLQLESSQKIISKQAVQKEEKRYLISAKWWRQWCDYANFEQNGAKQDMGMIDLSMYQSDNDLDQLTKQVSKDLVQLKTSPQGFKKADQVKSSSYPKPGQIINQYVYHICLKIFRDILKEGKSTELKEDLVEHFDYKVVSIEVWKHFYSWYSSDWTVMRFMKRDKTNKKTYYLDLYPEKQMYNKFLAQEGESDQFESESEQSLYNQSLLRLRDLE